MKMARTSNNLTKGRNNPLLILFLLIIIVSIIVNYEFVLKYGLILTTILVVVFIFFYFNFLLRNDPDAKEKFVKMLVNFAFPRFTEENLFLISATAIILLFVTLSEFFILAPLLVGAVITICYSLTSRKPSTLILKFIFYYNSLVLTFFGIVNIFTFELKIKTSLDIFVIVSLPFALINFIQGFLMVLLLRDKTGKVLDILATKGIKMKDANKKILLACLVLVLAICIYSYYFSTKPDIFTTGSIALGSGFLILNLAEKLKETFKQH